MMDAILGSLSISNTRRARQHREGIMHTFNRRFALSAGLWLMLLAAAGGTAWAQSNPVPLINQPLVPDAVEPGEISQNSASYKFTIVNPPGSDYSEAWGINRSGEIVGDYIESDGITRGFLYKGGVYTTVEYPGAAVTALADINSEGIVVGGFILQTPGYAEGLVGAGGFRVLNYPLSISSGNNGVNDQGDIVGAYLDDTGHGHGFLFNRPTFFQIDFPGGNGTRGTGISNSGQIVGVYADAEFKYHGFLYSSREGNYRTVDVPGASGTGERTLAINDSGEIVGDFEDASSHGHGFVRIGRRLMVLDFPGASETFLDGVSNSGEIVGLFLGVGCPNQYQGCGFLATPLKEQ
jgi:probable HAF family extracellular repeat protein